MNTLKAVWALPRWGKNVEQVKHLIRAVIDSAATKLEVTFTASADRDALKELCETKIVKDVQGDTPEYRRRRDAAWEAAFACFPEYRPNASALDHQNDIASEIRGKS